MQHSKLHSKRYANLATLCMSVVFLFQIFISSTASAQTFKAENLELNGPKPQVIDFSQHLHSHGFALHGDLKYPKNFKHFDYVNPSAPKGGKLRLMGFGTFDSLNPYTLKGTSPFNTPGQFMYGFSELNETLLAGTGSYSPSGDEPQSAYGLLAESLTYPKDYAWVKFNIRTNATFHDGVEVTAADVVFSYHTLIEKGHPRFQQSLLNIASVEALTNKEVLVRFTARHQGANILRIGEMPILPMHYWQDKDFESASQIPPLLSGPYELGSVDIGNSITLKRKADFWGKDLNLYQGRYNFDKISIDYYRDQSIAFEAFKSDEFDLYYDYIAKNWASAYNFPAHLKGKVLKREIKHHIPSGTQGIFFNTRLELFKDERVRHAISLMFDFEWTNKSLFNGAYLRNTTYYPNSDFAAQNQASDAELKLLRPHQKQWPRHNLEKVIPTPKTKGNGKLRPQIKQALALLKGAGWQINNNILTHQDSGKTFTFELLIRQAGLKRVILPFLKNLKRIGITGELRLVDTSQYKARIDHFDFDMMTFVLSQGNAPSYEQRDYFHSSTANIPGSQNYAGIQNPLVDTLIENVLSSQTRGSLITAMRALDRVLLANHYIVPNWHLDYHRLANWDRFEQPKQQPRYTLGIDSWWLAPRLNP